MGYKVASVVKDSGGSLNVHSIRSFCVASVAVITSSRSCKENGFRLSVSFGMVLE